MVGVKPHIIPVALKSTLYLLLLSLSFFGVLHTIPHTHTHRLVCSLFFFCLFVLLLLVLVVVVFRFFMYVHVYVVVVVVGAACMDACVRALN